MHIAYLMPPIERYSPVSGGAVATCAMQQARRLLSRGHEVSVLAGVFDETYPVGNVVPIRVEQRDTLHKLQRGVSRLRRMYRGGGWLYYEYYCASFIQSLRRLQPTPKAVVVFNDLLTPKYVKQALPRTKVVVRLSNEVELHPKHVPSAFQAIDCITSVSSYIKDWTLRRYALSEERVVVIPNGADVQTFSPRVDYLAPRETIKILFIGRLNPDKGPDLVADAVAELQAQGLPVELTVAGAVWWYGNEGQEQDPFVRKVLSRLKEIGATYAGHVTRPNVPELIRSHDIVCTPARWNDPMPQVVFEAMASGCAVVASRRGGIPEACGEAAMLVDPDRPAEVVESLRRLATEPDLLNERKRRSVARAHEMTWDHNARALEEVLERL